MGTAPCLIVGRGIGTGALIAILVGSAGCMSDKAWREAYGLEQSGAVAANPSAESTPTNAPAEPEPEFFDPFAVSSTGGDAPVERPESVDSTLALYGQLMTSTYAGRPAIGRTLGDASVTRSSFAEDGADFDPDVSPDGSKIVFASTQHKPTADIYVKDVDGVAVTQLTSGPAHEVMPKFSPDGTRVAFASNSAGSWDIYVISAEGGNAVQITTGSAHELHPTWSPDGRSLAFCRLGEVSGKWELWVTEAANTGVQHFIGYGMFPEWCPRPGTGYAGADQILFQRSRERGDRAFSVWTMDYKDGHASRPTEVASSPVAACINPTWSRDGAWVVFATVPNPSDWTSDKPEASDLWLASLNGHGRVNLTSSHTVDLMPVWGPDNKVFYVSDRGGVDNIWEIDVSQALYAATGQTPGDEALTQAQQRAADDAGVLAGVEEDQ